METCMTRRVISPLSIDNTSLPSTDTLHPTSIDIPSQTSINIEPRDMVATLILIRDNNGDLHDQEGHLRNAVGQRIDAQGAAIPEPDATPTDTTLPVDEAAQPRTLADDNNRPDRYHTNRLSILPPTIESDFELKAQYIPSSTRSNKESQLIFSPDPTSLERTIRKEARSLSTDNNTSVSLDSVQPPSTQTPVPSTDSRSPLSIDNTNLPSTDTLHSKSIDIPSRTSIDTEPRDMVAPLILVQDNNGDLDDQEGHLRNATVEVVLRMRKQLDLGKFSDLGSQLSSFDLEKESIDVT
ncbi:hypothetical protein F2Q70_00004271 [Brassica cretica]|uniref:Uncharacterized protein n=1 Tax=Brassica cretica TaxID=69181 RepID=A0A8S9IXS3_BRACR|nr:hypothetical protein F2Q70_00004271 [Brassica cretica]